MINKLNVNKSIKDLKEIRRLYDVSFPDDERIPFQRLLNSMDKERILDAYYEDEQLIGLSFVFLSNDLVYLSYICVEEDVRDRGYGAMILQSIQSEYSDYRIVLDIEEVSEHFDNYEERRKRRDFYIRNGFTSANVYYHIYNVDYELLQYNGTVTKEDWHALIRKHWGPFADSAIYRDHPFSER